MEDEFDGQVTLDQAGLQDRHREVVLEIHPAFRTAGVTAPLREQDGSGLAARRFRIAVKVEILQQLVCLGLRALVVVPIVLPRVAIDRSDCSLHTRSKSACVSNL